MTVLRQRMIDDMQLRNLATSTQKHYIACVAGFARHFGTSPGNLDIEAVRQFQLYLTCSTNAGSLPKPSTCTFPLSGFCISPP